MNIIKPDYYEDFSCTGKECSFTCCQEWKIAVDDCTKEKWKDFSADIDGETVTDLTSFVNGDEAGSFIRLNSKGKCPLLRKDGLCSVVYKYGENAISNTCHTFPREMHAFDGRVEFALAMGCPSALDLLWNRKELKLICDYCELDILKDDYFEYNIDNYTEDIVVDEYLLIREKLIKLFGRNESIETIFKSSFFLLINCYENECSETLNIELINDIFAGNELGDLFSQIDSMQGEYADSVIEQNELLLDLVDNYRKKKIYFNDIEEISLLAEYYEENEKLLISDRADFDLNYWPEYENKIRLLIKEELYSSLYTPGSDLVSVMAKFEWLAITYVAIRHFCFLFWQQYKRLDYKDFRRIVAVLIRMTGYSDEDIEEYLENCFEDLIWEYGYMALVMGEIKE